MNPYYSDKILVMTVFFVRGGCHPGASWGKHKSCIRSKVRPRTQNPPAYEQRGREVATWGRVRGTQIVHSVRSPASYSKSTGLRTAGTGVATSGASWGGYGLCIRSSIRPRTGAKWAYESGHGAPCPYICYRAWSRRRVDARVVFAPLWLCVRNITIFPFPFSLVCFPLLVGLPRRRGAKQGAGIRGGIRPGWCLGAPGPRVGPLSRSNPGL